MFCKVQFSENKVNLHGSALSDIALRLGCHSSVETQAKNHYGKDECMMNKPACHECSRAFSLSFEQGDIDCEP